MVPQKLWLGCALIAWLLTGCNYPTNQPAIETGVAATLAATPSAAASATATAAPVLPHALYYLSDRSGSQQVWRLERDGVTQIQITNESGDVLAFDVSQQDGSVAFVTNNQLYLVDSQGEERKLLVDDAAANPDAPDYYTLRRISDPAFSPDGVLLAYGYGGVWIADLATFQAVQFSENQVASEGAPERYFAPLAWAQDSQQLLLATGSAQSSSLGILHPDEEPPVIEVENEGGIVCCHAAWAPDSSAVNVASPYFGLVVPGLWRFDAATGARTDLLADDADGVFHFAGWPLQTADGSMFYFYANAAELPDGDVPLFMVRSAADGVSGRSQLRPDAFSNIGQVLWAQDGSLAVVVQQRPDGGPGGAALLAFSDERQLQLLLEDAYALRWGP